MIEARIEADVEGVRERLGELGGQAPSVLSRAINRALTNIKKNMAQQTGGNRGAYNIQSSTVKGTLEEKKATVKSLSGHVRSSGTPILLSRFNARIKPGPMEKVSYGTGKPSPQFYSAAVRKRGGKKAMLGNPKAFIAPSKAGLTFLQRLSGKGYPLKPLYGPSVPQMIGNGDTVASIQKEAESTLQKRIDAEVENILRKGQL